MFTNKLDEYLQASVILHTDGECFLFFLSTYDNELDWDNPEKIEELFKIFLTTKAAYQAGYDTALQDVASLW